MASGEDSEKFTTLVSPEHDPNNEYFTFQGDNVQNPKQDGTMLVFASGEKYDLLSECNVEVWMESGTAPHNSRSFGELKEQLKKSFPKANLNVSILKFLAHVVRVAYHSESIVWLSSFCDLVRWFGPFQEIIHKQKKTCVCLCNLEVLMTDSQVLVEKQKISWFAGHMSSTEAEEKLRQQGCGTYLVRFSESERGTGSFALSIVTGNGVTEHVNIQGNPELANAKVEQNGANLLLRYCGDADGRTYPNLPVLLDKRLMDEPFHDEHPDTTCLRACPNLPLNAIFKAYKNKT